VIRIAADDDDAVTQSALPPAISEHAINNRTNGDSEGDNNMLLVSSAAASEGGPLSNLWNHFLKLHPYGKYWIMFIGTSVLLFEGSITLLLPLIQAVPVMVPSTSSTKGEQLNPDQIRFPTVYRKTIVSVQVFMAVFAMICWMSFGDNVNTVLTTSLPDGYLATSVQLAYSLAVLFTFPFQHYPALEIACRPISLYLLSSGMLPTSQYPGVSRWLAQRNLISSCLVCLLAMIAWMAMDALDRVVSLMGSLIGCPVAFIVPPMIHTKLVPNLSPQRILMNKFVSLLGAVAMVVSSVTTLLQWRDR
jgi:proton-coupled amino acid transporter